MKRFVCTVILLLAIACPTAAQQTHFTVPGSTATFMTDLQAFLLGEEPARFADIFTPFVVSGGTHAPVAGLTGTPAALLAYPGGYYATETGAITYPNNSTCWVVATYTTTSTLTGSFARVAGTKYAIDCVSGAKPTAPANSVYLMEVTTAAGAITAVVDLRTLSPISPATAGFPLGTGTVRVDSGVPSAATPQLNACTIAAGANQCPVAGTVGRVVRVTDNLRGVFADTGVTWVSVTGQANVVDFGADATGAVSSTSAVTAAIAETALYGGAVYFPAGTYKFSTSATLLSWTHLVGAGAETTMLTTAPGTPAFTWATGTTLYALEVDHLSFTGPGTAIKSTGTYDYLAWPRVHDVDFYANLYEGIHANMIKADLGPDNTCGWHGTPGAYFRCYYSKGNTSGNTTNINHIHHTEFSQCTGTECYYWEGGYQLENGPGNVFEANVVSNGPVNVSGVFMFYNHGNWYERNTAPSLITSTNDAGSGTIGNYIVKDEFNWYDLGSFATYGTARVYDASGSFALSFTQNGGTNFNAGATKYITRWNYPATANDTGVVAYWGNYLPGYAGALSGVIIGNPYSGAITVTGDTTIYGKFLVGQGAGAAYSTSRIFNVRYGSDGVTPQILCPVDVSSPGGSVYLVVLNSHSATTTSQTAIYLVSAYYNGTLNSSTKLSGDAQTFTIVGGNLLHTGTNTNTYVISVFKVSAN